LFSVTLLFLLSVFIRSRRRRAQKRASSRISSLCGFYGKNDDGTRPGGIHHQRQANERSGLLETPNAAKEEEEKL